MRYQILILFLISAFLINCGGNTEINRPANNGTNSTTPNKANTNSPLGTNKTESVKTGEAPTITPVVQGYYEALKKKDEAGAKKYLSAAALKYYEDEAKSEKKPWFAFVLEENEPVDEKREIQNEKIDGEKAVAELKGGSLGVWTKVVFVKENGEWKFASPEETIKESTIKKTETLSNTSK
jgi:hypothetical protein